MVPNDENLHKVRKLVPQQKCIDPQKAITKPLTKSGELPAKDDGSGVGKVRGSLEGEGGGERAGEGREEQGGGLRGKE